MSFTIYKEPVKPTPKTWSLKLTPIDESIHLTAVDSITGQHLVTLVRLSGIVGKIGFSSNIKIALEALGYTDQGLSLDTDGSINYLNERTENI